MKIKLLRGEFSVCRLRDLSGLNLTMDLFFFAKTPDELSLVCATGEVPGNVMKADHGWRVFRVEGPLDFSLVGILAEISRVLAGAGISLFAASTFDTDYILVKSAKVDDAAEALRAAGHDLL